MTRPRSFLNTPLEGKLSSRTVVLIFCLSFTLSYLLFTGESASSTSGPLPPSAFTFDGSLYPPPPASLRSASASSGDINAIPFRSQPLVPKAPRAGVVPPSQLFVQPASLPAAGAAGVAGGGVAPPPPPPYCPSQQGVYRGVVDPASVVPYLGLVPGVLGGGGGGGGPGGPGSATFPHAHHPNPTCPRYLLVNQNHDAGGGHRLRQWSTSLWLAMALSHSLTSPSSLFTPTSPLPAFAHTSLDQGVGPHGGYPGMDELLGLGVGEGVLQVVGEGCCGEGELEPWLAAKGISLVPLPRENIQAYTPNAAALALWSGIMAQHTGCNVAFLIPRDHWAADHGTLTRNASVWKFAMAAALAAEATVGNTASGGGGVVSQQQQKQQQQASPLPRPHPRILSPPSQWPPHAIHIGLHFRVNDGLLVSDGDLTSVVKLTLLPALAAAMANATDAGGAGAGAALAATPIHLHVFSESESPTTEAPLLLGLNGTPIPLTSLAGPGGAIHLRVFHYGPGQASSLDTIHALSQCDVFVGCVSSLSWAVAQFSSRPYPLMQRWGGDYAWCVTGGLCCEGGGCEVNGGARDGLQAHLDKLARMAACGALNERSWGRVTLEQLTTISG